MARRSQSQRASALVIACIFLSACAPAASAYGDLGFPRRGDEAEPKALQLRLTHANLHALPNAVLPAFSDLVQRDRLRLHSRQSAAARTQRSLQRSRTSRPQGTAAPGAIGVPLSSDAPSGVAQYVVDFQFGTPPTSSRLVVDTGSDLVWTKCQYRHSGRRTQAGYFNAEASSTFHPVGCQADDCQKVPSTGCTSVSEGYCGYRYSYVDGTVAAGILSYDTITANGVSINRTLFGCTDSSVQDSLQGVLGLGRGPASFVSQLGAGFGRRFSYCLVDHLRSATASNALVFGATRFSAAEQRQLQSTAFVQNPAFPSFYYVGIEGVSVGNRALSIPNDAWRVGSDGGGGTILDSGTSLSFLLSPAYDRVYAAFDRLLPYPRVNTSDPFPLCFKNAGVRKPYPELSITFAGGAVFKPPANNYIFETDEGVSCLAILEASGAFATNTIGNILQQNFVVEHDLGLNRLQFAPTDCSKH